MEGIKKINCGILYRRIFIIFVDMFKVYFKLGKIRDILQENR